MLGTALTLFFTCLTAYPLARREMPHRSPLLFLVLFTMLFSGGIVPNYLLVKNLGLIDSIWALVLPQMLTAFNIIGGQEFLSGHVPKAWPSPPRSTGPASSIFS